MNTNRSLKVPWFLILILALLFILSLAWFSYENYRAGSVPWQIATSAILLSIPLGLTNFSIGVLVMATRQKRSQGEISGRLAKFIYWTPRIAGILITVFVALFALDVFSEGASFWEMLGGFLIHASPAIAMAILLAFAWRWEQVGFYAFLLAAIYFLRFMLWNPLQNIPIFLIFSLPMLVIALLFWANWRWRDEIRSTKKSG
ncbi:MAG: hypothetical protein Q8N39_09595 [Pelolinea sp.]|nr:hypothetical protein [Pelolinea sp.]